MRDDNARAGQTFVAVGRYRGAGEALVKLGKRSVRVRFPDAQKSGKREQIRKLLLRLQLQNQLRLERPRSRDRLPDYQGPAIWR